MHNPAEPESMGKTVDLSGLTDFDKPYDEKEDEE